MKSIAAGAALVLLVLVLLFVLVGRDDAVRRDAPVAHDASLEDPGASQPMRAAPDAPSPRRTDDRHDLPSVADGPRRRDHRATPGDDSRATPVNIPDARTISPDVSAALARSLRRALAPCTTASLRVDATLTIAIHAHEVTITEAHFARRDAASTVDESCLRAKALGVSTRAEQESDLEHYAITMSLVLQ